jgi:hypothetical protein
MPPAVDEQVSIEKIHAIVTNELKTAKFVDIHTHLFQPALGQLGLWGIDELLTYHYLEAELFRFSNISPQSYWALTKQQRADKIWRTVFIENTPISEAARGVIAVLSAFGLPTDSRDLAEARSFFAAQSLDTHIGAVFQKAAISEAVMTNDPLDRMEAPLWLKATGPDPRFHAALRLDRLLDAKPDDWQFLNESGYSVEHSLNSKSIKEVCRFLDAWCDRMNPVYMAVSLADTFTYPEAASIRSKLLHEAILPICRDRQLPLSLMIGVRRQVNPQLKQAGDAAGRADLKSLENLCSEYPQNRFLVSLLSRENQHELCVYARKFANLMPFGCWWFLNNPSIVEEITRERIEMLGFSFIPQHSDARILEQVIYKWHNTRRTLAPILTNSYKLLLEDGRSVTRQQIAGDIDRLFHSNFESFCLPEAKHQ